QASISADLSPARFRCGFDPAGAYGSDFFSSRTVASAARLPSILGARIVQTSIAPSKNRIEKTSALTNTARYCFDALYSDAPADPTRPARKGVTEEDGHSGSLAVRFS